MYICSQLIHNFLIEYLIHLQTVWTGYCSEHDSEEDESLFCLLKQFLMFLLGAKSLDSYDVVNAYTNNGWLQISDTQFV